MAEISIWKAIKACIIILLIIVVLKKILQVFGDHKVRMARIEHGNYTRMEHEENLEEKNARANRTGTYANAASNVIGSVMGSTEYQNTTYPPAPIGYAQQPDEWGKPYTPNFQGGADEDVPDPEDIGYDDEHSGSEDISMGGGSFFDILSKVKKVATKKKKATKKAASNKKATKKTSSKKKGKK